MLGGGGGSGWMGTENIEAFLKIKKFFFFFFFWGGGGGGWGSGWMGTEK